MKPSFEQSRKNPFTFDAESADEPLGTPRQPESEKKKKDTGEKGKKEASENNDKHKNEKKPDKTKDKKEAKKPEQRSKIDEEILEIKKNKRQQLVERSFHYKKLYEETPIPHDPWIIARFMVAEHLLALHEQIEQPALDSNSVDEEVLLATFDYMGIIADKLEDPEAESTPEVQEACETIIQLVEETLQEDENHLVETLISANADKSHLPDKESSLFLDNTTFDPLAATSSAHLPTSAAALIAVLLHARQQAPRKVHQDTTPPHAERNEYHPTSHWYARGGAGTTTSSPVDVASSHQRETRTAHPKEPPIVTGAPRQASRLETPERTHHSTYPYESSPPRVPNRTPETLASLAVAATLVHSVANERPSIVEANNSVANSPIEKSFDSHTVSTRYVPSTHAAETASFQHMPATSVSSQKPQFSPAVHHFEGHPTVHPTHEKKSIGESEHSSYKIEHLPLQSLLTMAETVSIGHGQRLRHAYEKGVIDKDGLIKVLKSHTKHHDFLQEFRQQVVKRRNLVQASPEFLTPHNLSDSRSPQVPAADNPINTTPPPQLPAPASRSSSIPSWPDFPNTAKNTPDTDPFNMHEQKTAHSAWFGIALLGILILGIMILVTLYLISR